MALSTAADPGNDEALAAGFLFQLLARAGRVSIAEAAVGAARSALVDTRTPAERLRAIADELDARVTQ